jgi:hypothetical protein
VSFLLPYSWAWENGPIENGDLAVLGAGLIAALLCVGRAPHTQAARLCLAAAPLWLLLIGRELSWGAVLIKPYAFEHGQPLYSSRYLWYQAAVLPAILLGAGYSLAVIWRYRLIKVVLQRLANSRQLLLTLVIGLLAAFIASAAEGHAGVQITSGSEQAMVLEELSELIAYAALFSCQALLLGN